MARPAPLSAPVEVGPYRVLRLLGRGGMGTVYLAHHRRLQRQVALKLVETGPGVSPELLERFRREGRLAARLDHPGIARVYEVGEADGFAFLAMEYVPGTPLGRLSRSGAFAPDVAAHLVQRMAAALDYAHRAGVVHRDLKPSNVIVDSLSRPHITDFGLAREVEGGEELARLTQTGRVMGTPAYMSPEQARGERDAVGPASDVYQLGAVFYHLLTGHPPFEGDGAVRVLYQVLHSAPVPPRRRSPAGPRDLERICLTAMQPDPRQRYRTALEMAQDIERYFRGHEIRGHGSVLGARLVRVVRDRPIRAAALASTALLLLSYAATALLSRARGVGPDAALAELRSRESQEAVRAGDVVGAFELARRAERLDPEAGLPSVEAARRAVAERSRTALRRGVLLLEEGRPDAALGFFEIVRQLERWEAGPDRAGPRLAPAWTCPPIEDSVRFVQPSPGGRQVLLLAGGWRLLGVRLGAEPVAAIDAPVPLSAAAAMPEGGIAVAGRDGVIRRLDSNGLPQGSRLLPFHDVDAIAAAAGGALAAAGPRGIALLAERGPPRATSARPAAGRVLALAWHREALWLFATVSSGVLVVLDGELREVHSEPAHRDRAPAVDVDAAGQWVATGGWDRRVRVRPIGRWGEAPVAWLELDFRVDVVRFDPSGRRLAVGGWGDAVVVYDTATWQVDRVLAGSEWGTSSLGWSVDGGWLAAGGSDGSVRAWELGPD